MSLTPCSSCSGFLPRLAVRCPHCGLLAPHAVLRALGRGFITTVAGGCASLTLAACYGAPPCEPEGVIDNDEDGAETSANGCLADGAQPDCNDNDASIHPDARDPIGDDVDQNCDGVDGTLGVDVCAPDTTDEDGDGFSPTGSACDPAELDCDDADAALNPTAEDAAGDDVDQNCDGVDGVAPCDPAVEECPAE